MAQSFNLVAQLQLHGPQNINQVVNRIQSRLNNISANVALNVSPASISSLRTFNSTLTQTNNILQQVINNAGAAQAALAGVAGVQGRATAATARQNQASQAAATNMATLAANSRVATSEVAEFGRISALAVRRFLAFSIPAGIIVGLTVSIKQGVKAAIEFEREMIRVQQVTGRTAQGLSSLKSAIGELSVAFGSSSNELVVVSRTLAQAGLSAKQTRIALAAIAKTDLSPTFDSMTQTTEGAIAAMRQFNLEADKLEAKLGAINAVAGSFAVESADIISAIRRTGGAFKAAGGNLEELIALFTSVRATTRESADSIATGFRTIFTRLQRPRTIQFLRDFNIELQEMGKFVGPYEAIERLSTALRQLDPRDVRFSRITEELGGFRQVSKVIPLIQQAAIRQQALNVAMAGGESISEDAATAQGSLAVQIAQVREEYQKLYREIVGSNLFKEMAGYALSLARNLAEVTRQLKPMIPLLTLALTMRGLNFGRQFATGFGRGLFSGASAGPGGGPRGFARGGMVPGTGSGDTVPAMLEPGEFVMRKRAVKAIGPHRLGQMNARRMAKGGKLTELKNYSPSAKSTPKETVATFPIGGVFLHPVGQAFSKVLYAQKDEVPGAPGAIKIPTTLQSLPSSVGRKLYQRIWNHVVGGVRKSADHISKSTGIPYDKPTTEVTKGILQQSGVAQQRDTLTGQIFEAALLRMGGSFAASKNNLDFDFTGGLPSRLQKLFPGVAQLQFVDAKKQMDKSAITAGRAKKSNSLRTKAVRVLNNMYRGLINAQGAPTQKGSSLAAGASAATKTQVTDGLKVLMQHTTGKDRGEIVKLMKGVLQGERGAAANLNKALGAAGVGDYRNVLNKSGLQALGLDGQDKGPTAATRTNLAKLTKLRGFATGGTARGTDTVPALLTPGEFVINKKSAQTIGYGNLSRMNRVQGYHAGGVVNQYARGGTVGGGAGGSLVSVVLLSTFIKSTLNLSDKMNDLVDSVTKAVLAFEVARMAMGAFQGMTTGLGGLFGGGGAGGLSRRAVGLQALGRAFGGVPNPFNAQGYSGLHPGFMGGAQRRPRIFGARSNLNVASKALTGFSAATVGATAAVAAGAAALFLLSSSAQDTANNLAKNAKNSNDLNKAYAEQRKASTLKSAGYGLLAGAGAGAATGALLGSVIPGFGTAVGAVVGGAIGTITGAIVGSNARLEKEMKALRKINRQARGEEVEAKLTQALERLTSGDENVTTSRFLGVQAEGIRDSFKLLQGASRDQDSEEILSRTKAIRSTLPQLSKLQKDLVDAGAGAKFFESSATAGGAIVRALAFAQRKTTKEVTDEIKAEIDARKKAIADAKARDAAIAEANNSVAILRRFNTALELSAQRLELAADQIAVSSALASGEVTLGNFKGRPGLGNFGSVVDKGISDRGQYMGALEQVFDRTLRSGGPGQKTFERTRDLAIMLDELPKVLAEIGQNQTLDQDQIQLQFLAKTDDLAKNLEGGKAIQNIIASGIERLMNTQREGGGPGQFTRLATSDPQKLLREVGGKEFKEYFSELDEIAKQMISSVDVLDGAMKKRVSIELAIVDQTLKIAKQRVAAEQQMFDLFNRNVRNIPGLVAQADTNQQKRLQAITTGTRAPITGAVTDPVNLGNALRAVNKEIEKLSSARQGQSGQQLAQTTERLTNLNVEAQRLRTALQDLTDVSEKATAIQKTLNLLEEQKKARFSLAEQYTYGTLEDRQNILRNLILSAKESVGQFSINDLPGELRQGILGVRNSLENTPALVHGLGPDGKPLTGKERNAITVTGEVRRIGKTVPGYAQPFLGKNFNTVADDIDPTKLNPAQQALKTELENLFKTRETAEQQFLNNLLDRDAALTTTIQTEFANFSATLSKELQLADRRSQERQVSVAKGEKDLAEAQKGLLTSARTEIEATTGIKGLSDAGVVKTVQALADPKNQKQLSQIEFLAANKRALDTYLAGKAPVSKTFGDTRAEGFADFGSRISVLGRSLRFGGRSMWGGTQGADLNQTLDSIYGQGGYLAQRNLLDENTRNELANRARARFQKAFETYEYKGRDVFSGKEFSGEFEIANQKVFRELLGSVGEDIQGELNKQLTGRIKGIASATGFGEAGYKDVAKLLDQSRKELTEFGAKGLNKLSPEAAEKLTDSVNKLNERFLLLKKTLDSMQTEAAIEQDYQKKAKKNEQAALQAAKRRTQQLKDTAELVTKSRGGTIFKPRGTDTVPAMLTPGEFVVNKTATQKHMGVLKAINSGTFYAADGGVAGMNEAERRTFERLSPYYQQLYLNRRNYEQGRAEARRRHEEEKNKARKEHESRPRVSYRQREEQRKFMFQMRQQEELTKSRNKRYATDARLRAELKQLNESINSPGMSDEQIKRIGERMASLRQRIQHIDDLEKEIADAGGDERAVRRARSNMTIDDMLQKYKNAQTRLEAIKAQHGENSVAYQTQAGVVESLRKKGSAAWQARQAAAKIAAEREARKQAAKAAGGIVIGPDNKVLPKPEKKAAGIYIDGQPVTSANREKLLEKQREALGIKRSSDAGVSPRGTPQVARDSSGKPLGKWRYRNGRKVFVPQYTHGVYGERIISADNWKGKTNYASGYFESPLGRKATPEQLGLDPDKFKLKEDNVFGEMQKISEEMAKRSGRLSDIAKRQLEIEINGEEDRALDAEAAKIRAEMQKLGHQREYYKRYGYHGGTDQLQRDMMKQAIIDRGQMELAEQKRVEGFERRTPGSAYGFRERRPVVRTPKVERPEGIDEYVAKGLVSDAKADAAQAVYQQKQRDLAKAKAAAKAMAALSDKTPGGGLPSIGMSREQLRDVIMGENASVQKINETYAKLMAEHKKRMTPVVQGKLAYREQLKQLGLRHLPVGVEFDHDLTKDLSESLRKTKKLVENPTAYLTASVVDQGLARVNLSSNAEYWKQRPEELKAIAQKAAATSLDAHFGRKEEGQIVPASKIATSPIGAWLRDPRNSARWQKALINQHLAGLPEGSNRIEAMRRYSRTALRSPHGVFASILAGGTPELDALRGELTQVMGARRFHGGGMVPGVSEQAAILRGGEYVMSRDMVQRFANGGIVSKGGKSETSSAAPSGPTTYELVLASDAKSTIDAMTQAMNSAGSGVREAFAEIPGQIRESLEGFPAQLESSADVLREAAATFEASIGILGETAAELPEAIRAALGESSAALKDSVAGLGTSVTDFSTALGTFGQNIGQLSEVATALGTAAEGMKGAASEIAAALAQEVQITVTHTHEPITVRIEGGEATVQNGEMFEESVMNVVGPEIDKMVARVRDQGFGMG